MVGGDRMVLVIDGWLRLDGVDTSECSSSIHGDKVWEGAAGLLEGVCEKFGWRGCG